MERAFSLNITQNRRWLIILYDIGFAIFSIFYLPALIFKGKLHGDFGERFGNFSDEKRRRLEEASGAIWIQAVSVGEVALCRGLIPELKRLFPQKSIVLSTITRTGNDLARKLFADTAIIIYFPLDFSAVVKRLVSLIKPSLYVMIETEIWPNVLRELSYRKVPSILVNGRISDRSFGKYKLARAFLKETFGMIDSFCMQSNIDIARIEYLGAPRARVHLTGNMKFDTDAAVDPARSDEMRRLLDLGQSGLLVVGGSTHCPEEKILLRIFRKLSAKFPDLRLLLAPRHVDRVFEIEALVKRCGFDPVRVSALPVPLSPLPVPRSPFPVPRSPIFILDTIGRLKDAYSVAGIVFVGGSLAKHGGQNPIEPAALARPILFGPHMFNFKDVRRILLDAGAAVEVRNGRELSDRIKLLINDDQERIRLGTNAARAVADNRGVTAKNLDAIKGLMK